MTFPSHHREHVLNARKGRHKTSSNKEITWLIKDNPKDAPFSQGWAARELLKRYSNCLDAGYTDRGRIYGLFKMASGNKIIVEYKDTGGELVFVSKDIPLSRYK